MNLVPADAPYSETKSQLSPEQQGLTRSAFGIIQAFRMEVSEHDEDPNFDADDALSALMKSFGFGKALATHFMSGDANVPKDIEAISHGMICNLGVLDEPTPEAEQPSEPDAEPF